MSCLLLVIRLLWRGLVPCEEHPIGTRIIIYFELFDVSICVRCHRVLFDLLHVVDDGFVESFKTVAVLGGFDLNCEMDLLCDQSSKELQLADLQ